MPQYQLQQIADCVGGQLLGAGDMIIRGVDRIDAAGPAQITFIGDQRHAQQWVRSSAVAALVSSQIDLEPGPDRALIRVEDADLALVKVLDLFAPVASRPDPGIHTSAMVDVSAHVSPDAAVGPFCVVGKRVRIGSGCVLHGHVTVLDDSELGPGCVLFPGTVIYDRCRLGSRVTVHANAVIGADGFGYRRTLDGLGLPIKIPQIGSVEIGNDVEIGAGSCIDRGKFSATTIGDGTKIDNLCQIAHNCRVGRGCLLAGQAGLAGSAVLGDGVVMGGQAGVTDHVHIGSGATLAGRSCVLTNVPRGANWFGHPARHIHTALREIAALRRLPGLMKTLRRQRRSGESPSVRHPGTGSAQK